MTDLMAARSTMAFSLGFHIIFAAVGMTMPFFMSAAHYLFLKKKNPEYLELTKMWMKGVAILFAVGAVSGTVLSFELGLLWPGFMKYAGPIIGMPFSWEGTAFFLEAIAIGLFLYGWKKMRPWVHWGTGLMVGISGFASGVFVVAANGWMNSPAGFDWVNGEAMNIDPVAAMFNKAWLHQTLHMQFAALQAVGFAVAGIHAFLYLRGRAQELHLKAFKIAMCFGAAASIAQPFIGHFAAQRVAVLQPVKLAAMEGHFKTERQAPLHIGGIPNAETQTMDYSIPLPGMLSFLAFNDFDAEVMGLDQVPRELWPPLVITHISFQIMVAIGTAMALIAVLFFVYQRKNFFPSWLLKTIIAFSPLGFVAMEAGWIVTEVGRQPWIIYGILKTRDAVTPVPGMKYHFFLFLALYLFLSFVTVWLLKRQVVAAQRKFEVR
ncbi:cytochrome BD ubiquinol oxidase subunit I [Bdellovibrio bacteriovorus]|uniref:Cytochrome BD ubiquinol oxidase subunit I n=1 Tax=Bdellovibrio bacteriovorus TaxID=959 RepID=A0A162G3E9_BDEBC|nr:cytochrome ubiquinol oxidase subunit I [Bdellovibrio bacteriovorus]KYG64229.1 cytochrome BD ubiquinol oxidase subunit I [Bdellovibrio bacteriovorus]